MDDNSLMTFGKHKGKKLKDVPAEYLLWWYYLEDSDKQNEELWYYIDDNFESIEQEGPYRDIEAPWDTW